MNANRKKAAIAKYSKTPPEELRAALMNDEKGYTEEEVSEIFEALTSESEEQEPEVTEQPKSEHYQEWDVRITNGKYVEKLKITRPVVKISDKEAEVLNKGVTNLANSYAKMYFKPE